jgi:prolipoprotein diacylglyceryltransferase
MNAMFIQLPSPGLSYSILYSLAFILALALLIYEGIRRKFPILPWILILTFSRILLVIGSKIFTFSPAEWYYMIENQMILPTSGKVLYGSLLLWGFGLFIGKFWMRFKQGLLDAFAVAIPLAGGVIRLGCFLNGCCYGKPSSLPWAVQYPVNTLPHFHHYEASLIGQTETLSLPVHPSQLYEVIGIIIVVALLLTFRKYWKSSGSLFLFSIILYAIVRFITEFFRDPMAHTSGGTMIGWLNQTQWIVAGLIPALTILLYYREKHVIHQRSTDGTTPSLFRIISFLSFSAFLIWILKDWFQPMEIYTLLVIFILALFLTLFYIFRNYQALRYRLAYAGFLLLPLLLMSQIIPETKKDTFQIRRSKSIGIGFGAGNFDNKVDVGTGQGCDRVSQVGYFNHKYNQIAGSLNFKEENLTEKSISNYGFNILGGSYSENKYNAPQGSTDFIWDINPYIKKDIKFIGFGAGLHLGNIGYAFENFNKEGSYTPLTGRKIFFVYPQFYFRLGPQKFFFIDYHFADFFPSSLPGFKHQLGIGSSFGSEDGITLRTGTSFHGFYVSAFLPGKKIAIEPLLHFNRSIFDIYSSGLILDPTYEKAANKYNLQFSISVRYDLGSKSK